MNKKMDFVKEINMISGKPNKLTQIFLEDHGAICYKPSFVKITGGVMSAILLNQIMYWAKKSDNHFYKFRNANEHKWYKCGDSWCEELGFTGHEFDGAIKKIGQRLKVGDTPQKDVFVWYYTDFNRVTWYVVNWQYLNEAIYKNYDIESDILEREELIPKSANSYLRKMEIANSENRKQLIPNIGNTIYKETETTKDYNHRQHTDEAADYQLRKTTGDDDDYILLEKFGLSKKQCVKIMKSHSSEDIKIKAEAIKKQISTGSIKNIAAYASSVYENNNNITITEEIKQEKETKRREKATQDAEKQKAEAQAEQEAISAKKESDIKAKKIIESASEDDIEKFEEHLVDKKYLWALYIKNKFESDFVKYEFLRWMGERDGK